VTNRPKQLAVSIGACAGLAAMGINLLVAISASMATFVAAHLVRARRATKLRSDYEQDLAMAMRTIGRSLHSGAGISMALRDAAGAGRMCGRDIEQVLHRAESSTLAQALEHWVAQTRSHAARMLATALLFTLRNGGSHAEAIDAVLRSLRDRELSRQQVRTQATQARSSAIVLALLPLAVIFLQCALDAEARRFMLQSSAGGVVVLLGTALDCLGILVMSSMVNRSLR
jgi:tight adherence protein B